MRLLLIDNYDSFTYLLVQYFEELACDLTVVTESENLSQVIRTSPDLICQIYDAIIISWFTTANAFLLFISLVSIRSA